jgi:hypothetical protein
MKNAILNEINNLIEYGYNESDLYKILSKKNNEYSEADLRRIIKSTLIENFLILKHRRMDHKNLIYNISDNFDVPIQASKEICDSFCNNEFNQLHDLIENTILKY